jgi:hypothetical protein
MFKMNRTDPSSVPRTIDAIRCSSKIPRNSAPETECRDSPIGCEAEFALNASPKCRASVAHSWPVRRRQSTFFSLTALAREVIDAGNDRHVDYSYISPASAIPGIV